jgi:glucose-6-phosphate 1-dehydrogenase
VACDSEVETFAAMRLDIDSWRWDGVPFFIRTGKRLPVTVTEVKVALKRPPMTCLATGGGNYLRLRLGPELNIALGARVKKAGESMTSEPSELMLIDRSDSRKMSAYERLLGDAIAGDATLFARQDAVEAAWSVVDGVLGDVTPVHEYAAGSWGPAEAERLTAAFGGWERPRASS